MLPSLSVTTTASGIASRTSCLLGTTFILLRWSTGPTSRSCLLAILALSGGRILVDAGHLSRARVLEHLGGWPERALVVSAVAVIPQEVPNDREDRDDNETDDVPEEAHGCERSMIAAVPYATTSVIVCPSSEESKRIITTAFAPIARAFSIMRSTA